jgi:hypothetical protein
VLICPGCGGRNDPAARACEWCGRPFVVERRRLPVLWIIATIFVVVLIIAALISIVAVIGARRAPSDPAASPPTFTQPVIEPEPESEPEATATSFRELTPTIEATATSESLPEFLQIGNTGGAGAFIRREPRPGAPGIVALRDGLPVRVLGPEQIEDGRSWVNVQDRNGNRGWTPREYLVPTQQRF